MMAALLVVLGACASGQDPGVPTAPAGGPSTTSRALDRCPPGGPDATTSPAGCVGEDGAVIHP